MLFRSGVTDNMILTASGSVKLGEELSIAINSPCNNENCKVYLDGKIINAGNFTESGEGTQYSYSIPYNILLGSHRIVFVSSAGAMGALEFIVEDMNSSISIDPASHQITLTGFSAEENIEIKQNGELLQTVAANPAGGAIYQPVKFQAGRHTLTAEGVSSKIFVCADIVVSKEVNPEITLSKSQAMPGNRVTVNFSGFDSEEKIAAYIGDISIELDSEFKTYWYAGE